MLSNRALLMLLVLAVMLASCAPAVPQSAPTPLPTQIAYHWDERAAVTLLRADQFTAPLSDFNVAARVPDCAVYGDGRVRWVEPPTTPGAQGRLYESPVDDQALADLLPRVVESDFFTLAGIIGPDLGPVREVMVRLEGMGSHTVQVATIESAPDAFNSLYAACAALRQPENATEVIPDAGWIHVYPVDNPGSQPQPWPDNAPQLAALASEPRWYANPALIGQIWTAQRDYGTEATYSGGFASDPQYYRVIVRAEGFTLDTPRAPRDQGAPLPITTAWLPAPNVRVFTAWLAGGLPTAHDHTGPMAVPACTVFGDGRVIISDQPRGEVQVGTLTERQMTGFMEGWLNTGFFDATPDPTPALSDAVTQIVTIILLDDENATRRYPLNTAYITGAPNPCDDLTVFEPYMPDYGYMWTEELGPEPRFAGNVDYRLIPWPSDLPLLAHLKDPRWFSDEETRAPDNTPVPLPLGITPTAPPVSDTLPSDALQFAWAQVHGGTSSSPNIVFTQQGLTYAVYFNIPRVTISWPE